MEGGSEDVLGGGVFGHHHKPRSALVQPVDRVEAGLQADLMIVVYQPGPQGVIPAPGAGVDRKAGGLVATTCPAWTR